MHCTRKCLVINNKEPNHGSKIVTSITNLLKSSSSLLRAMINYLYTVQSLPPLFIVLQLSVRKSRPDFHSKTQVHDLAYVTTYPVQLKNYFYAFMHKFGLSLQSTTIQCNQLLIEVDSEEIKMILEVKIFCFSKRNGSKRTH